MKFQRKSGFTLIELLVVIAIIAILAAILFPVFAQAKMAAKKTVMVSNLKQDGYAVLLYQDGNDDVLPMKAIIGYDTNDPLQTWDKLVYPYAKSYQMFACAEDTFAPAKTPFGTTRRSIAIFHNYFRGVAVNPSWGWGNNLNYPPPSGSFAPKPAETLALGIKPLPVNLDVAINSTTGYSNGWSRKGASGKSDWTTGFGIYMTRRNDLSRFGYTASNQKIRADNGEVLAAYTDGSIFAFADGHAKYYRCNGVASDGVAQGWKFDGYKEGAFGSVNDKFYDQGIVCTDWPWISGQTGVCTIPGE